MVKNYPEEVEEQVDKNKESFINGGTNGYI